MRSSPSCAHALCCKVITAAPGKIYRRPIDIPEQPWRPGARCRISHVIEYRTPHVIQCCISHVIELYWYLVKTSIALQATIGRLATEGTPPREAGK